MSGHDGLIRPPTTQGPVTEVEHWVEVNLMAELEDQNAILLKVLRPHVRRLRESRSLVAWHHFREPEICFLIRV